VKQGDTIDFIVDYRADLHSDMFRWAPVISAKQNNGSSTAEAPKSWAAQKEFAGPLKPSIVPLTPWEQLAQVLLLANEFSFID
jgi:hypothetical protein